MKTLHKTHIEIEEYIKTDTIYIHNTRIEEDRLYGFSLSLYKLVSKCILNSLYMDWFQKSTYHKLLFVNNYPDLINKSFRLQWVVNFKKQHGLVTNNLRFKFPDFNSIDAALKFMKIHNLMKLYLFNTLPEVYLLKGVLMHFRRYLRPF